jgi:hypothetical protein
LARFWTLVTFALGLWLATMSGKFIGRARHGLSGSADPGFSCVIASRGKMADAMGFCVEWAERAQQAHSIVWWRWSPWVGRVIADPANPWGQDRW